MIGFIQFNKPSIGYQGTLTLKPLTVKTRFVGIIDQPIRGKYDCEQSRFYSRIVRKMGVLQFLILFRCCLSDERIMT